MLLTELAFWVSVFLILYPHLIYPGLMAVLATVRPRPVRRARQLPKLTILIPAHNEEAHIEATVANKLAQDYPRDRLQVLVVSDGSTDGTDEIVREMAAAGVELVRQEPRRGKAAALNLAVRHARGDVLVFSDANSSFAPDTVRLLAENFADPTVGYVTGRLTYMGDPARVSSGGSRAYMRYENLLRKWETRFHSVIGVNGGVDAMRRDQYLEVPHHLLSDFVLPLQVMGRGLRVVYDERAESTEEANAEVQREFRMRVRVALRGLQALLHMSHLLDPQRHPRVAFGLWSHKALRYTTVLLLPVALLSNLTLAPFSALYWWLLVAQLTGYALALLGLWSSRLPPSLARLTAVPAYFLVSSTAFAVAVFRLLRGDRMATWEPRGG
jgi:cellulose synthase/poly-beta-1,6-N-acetylglucosamine synthase-like glycosyltransferase